MFICKILTSFWKFLTRLKSLNLSGSKGLSLGRLKLGPLSGQREDVPISEKLPFHTDLKNGGKSPKPLNAAFVRPELISEPADLVYVNIPYGVLIRHNTVV